MSSGPNSYSTELLPCPFCGSGDVEIVEGWHNECSVVCHGCHIGTGHSPSKKVITDSWNKRVAVPSLPSRDCPITLDKCRKSYMAGGCTDQCCLIQKRLDGPSMRLDDKPVAWLIVRILGRGPEVELDVVLSPLTDDVHMDEGDEAWPLYKRIPATHLPSTQEGK